MDFNNPTQPLPVVTKADIDRILIFRPPILNVTYTGRCVGNACAAARGHGLAGCLVCVLSARRVLASTTGVCVCVDMCAPPGILLPVRSAW